MQTEGFNESDFYLELELYDIVRPPTWQSWKQSAISKSTKPTSSASPSNSRSTKIHVPDLNPNDSLPQNLELFASSIYDIDDASFFVDFLQHELAQKVASLSLDELERLAGAIAQRKS